MKNVIVTTFIAGCLVSEPVTAQPANRLVIADNLQSLQTSPGLSIEFTLKPCVIF